MIYDTNAAGQILVPQEPRNPAGGLACIQPNEHKANDEDDVPRVSPDIAATGVKEVAE
jgi:hypothetical protein